ncbi:MAG: ABC transporter substrate-binding protein [Verrucomicrobiota bacterium]
MKQLTRRSFIGTAALAGGAALMGGCGGGKNKPPAENTAAGAAAKPPIEEPYVAQCEPGIKGGRFVIANFSDPKSFNPITANETSSNDVNDMMFYGLLGKNQATQELYPALAAEWSVAEDKKTWTIRLRKGLKWSDGQPITADDVVFTLNDCVYNKDIVNVTADPLRIDGKDFAVSKVDDLTVKVVTPDIYAPFLEFFGDVRILPKHVLGALVKENPKNFESAYGVNTPPEKLVCSGPYRLKQYKAAEFTLLERNPYFFVVDKKGQQLPYFDTVVHSVVPDQNAISLRFLKGDCDVQEFVRPEEAMRFKAEAANGKFKLLELGVASQMDLISFNQNPGSNKSGKPYIPPHKLKWFQNTKFRQAISHAIDRESIIKSSLNGLGKPNYGFWNESNPKWFNTQIPKQAYDLNKAKQLLAEIGIKDRNGDGFLEDEAGNPVEFELNTNAGNSRREKGSVLVQEDLKRLGIKVTYRPLDFNTLVAKLDATFDYECIFLGLASTSPEPTSSLNVLRSSGFSHQWYPRQKTPATPWEARIDELMNLQLKTLDFAERKKYVDEVQVIMSEQVPMIYTAAMLAFAGVRNNVANLQPTVQHNNRLFWNIAELYFRK